MNKEDILGVWKLASFTRHCKNEMDYPYGKNATGYLVYTEDYMSLHMMRSERPKWASNDLKNTTLQEKSEMADNYCGYSGRYEILNDMIIHYPEVANFPNFINSSQARHYKYIKNRLILECAVSTNGEQSFLRVIWEPAISLTN